LSILLPADFPDNRDIRHTKEITRSTPLYARLKGLRLWQVIFDSPSRPDTPSHPSPTAPRGKIRLVTSRWVDRPQATRAKDSHCPPLSPDE
jgi:hypothetical protein